MTTRLAMLVGLMGLLVGLAASAAGQEKKPPRATTPAKGAKPPGAAQSAKGKAAAADACPVPSALNVRIHPAEGQMEPAAEILLTDPKGRKTGINPLVRGNYQEIPYSVYEFEGIDNDETEENGPSSGIIDIWCQPEDGAYTLQVIGTASGEYELEVMGVDRAKAPSVLMLAATPIAKDVTHRYSIQYSKKAGAKVKVEPVEEAAPAEQK
jgi:hypothetical protein